MNTERSGRLIEIAISVGASIIASAVVVSWTISAALAHIQTRQQEQEIRITENTAAIKASEVVLTTHEVRIATNDARFVDILRRLDSIETKLDKLGARR